MDAEYGCILESWIIQWCLNGDLLKCVNGWCLLWYLSCLVPCEQSSWTVRSCDSDVTVTVVLQCMTLPTVNMIITEHYFVLHVRIIQVLWIRWRVDTHSSMTGWSCRQIFVTFMFAIQNVSKISGLTFCVRPRILKTTSNQTILTICLNWKKWALIL